MGFIALIMTAILYPSSLTFVLMLFLMTGLLTALLAHPEPVFTEEQKEITYGAFGDSEEAAEIEMQPIPTAIEMNSETTGWWDITRRTMRFDRPWLIFSSSLLAIFFISLGV